MTNPPDINAITQQATTDFGHLIWAAWLRGEHPATVADLLPFTAAAERYLAANVREADRPRVRRIAFITSFGRDPTGRPSSTVDVLHVRVARRMAADHPELQAEAHSVDAIAERIGLPPREVAVRTGARLDP